MSRTSAMRGLLRAPYVLGGRDVATGLDCLGVVLIVLRELGLCAPDPWRSLIDSWAKDGTTKAATGFPTCWLRMPEEQIDVRGLRDGDVLIFHSEHQWVGCVADGCMWSSDPRIGRAYNRPLRVWQKKPAEAWRHDPSIH